jgi:hypothetical protein
MLVLECSDRRARNGGPLFGKFDREVAQATEDGEDFGADVGGKVERPLEEQIVEPVELLLGLVCVAGEVFRASELADEAADDFDDCHCA